MALEMIGVTRRQVAYFNQSVANGSNLAKTLQSSATSPIINRAAGCSWLQGYVLDAVAPAAGFPSISFYNGPTGTVVAGPYSLAADPTTTNGFIIAAPTYTPWFSIDLTQGGSSGNVFIECWAYPDIVAGGASSIGPTTPVYVKDYPLTPLGYQQISVTGSTSTLTVPAGALYAQFQIDQGGTNVTCRWRDDGTAPTAAIGNPLIPGVTFFYEGGTTGLAAFTIIGTGAGPSNLNVNYYK